MVLCKWYLISCFKLPEQCNHRVIHNAPVDLWVSQNKTSILKSGIDVCSNVGLILIGEYLIAETVSFNYVWESRDIPERSAINLHNRYQVF